MKQYIFYNPKNDYHSPLAILAQNSEWAYYWLYQLHPHYANNYKLYCDAPLYEDIFDMLNLIKSYLLVTHEILYLSPLNIDKMVVKHQEENPLNWVQLP